jgi:D-alanyl-lipoteichoic acid acyltransferase DltB (MBOAT superfamily)
MMGIVIPENFNYPYIASSFKDFWKRWHISLSSWIRDYLYLPLSNVKVVKTTGEGGIGEGLETTSQNAKTKGLFLTWAIMGLWHGANWTFIFWGFLHAVYIIPSVIFSSNRSDLDIVAKDSTFPTLNEIFRMGYTFTFVSFALLFFRSDSLSAAFNYLSLIPKQGSKIDQLSMSYPFISICIMLFLEWFDRKSAIPFLSIQSLHFRRFAYLLILLLIFFMGAFINPRSFIYFQF